MILSLGCFLSGVSSVRVRMCTVSSCVKGRFCPSRTVGPPGASISEQFTLARSSAAGCEYADIEQLFPHWGAKLDVIDTHDWTPLHVIQSRLQSGKCSKTVIFESLIRNVAKANGVRRFPLLLKIAHGPMWFYSELALQTSHEREKHPLDNCRLAYSDQLNTLLVTF